MSFFNTKFLGQKIATAAIMGVMLFGSAATVITYAPQVEAQSVDRVRYNDSTPTVNQEVRMTLETSGYRNAAVGLDVIKPGDTEFTEVQPLTYAHGARGTQRSLRFTPDRVGTYVLKIKSTEGGRRHTINTQTKIVRLMVNDGRRAGQRRLTSQGLQLTQHSGDSTQLFMNAQGGSSTLVYQYEYKRHGWDRPWQKLQHHATNSRVNFNPSTYGIYEVKGWVKESSANGGPSDRSLFFKGNPNVARNLQLNIPRIRRAESKFTVTASSDSSVRYRFFMVSPNSPTVIVWVDAHSANSARFTVPYAGQWLIGVEAQRGRDKNYSVQEITVSPKIMMKVSNPKDPKKFKKVKIKRPVINLKQ